ncbi:MAG: response regulator [Hyphomonadaceae bacterium]
MMPRDKHIIMIDDDREDAFLMRRALRAINTDIEFEHVIDSEFFLQDLTETRPSYGKACVLLIDLNMPGIDGFEVIKAVRADVGYRNAEIVMLTSSNREEDQDRALALGANRFATKPNTLHGMSELAISLLS